MISLSIKILLFGVLALGVTACVGNYSENHNPPIRNAAKLDAAKQDLFLALLENDPTAARRYLTAEPDVNWTHKSGSALLHMATMFAADKTAAVFLADGAGVNAKTESGVASLVIATIIKADRVLALLLSHGTDTSLPIDGFTPLFYASSYRLENRDSLLDKVTQRIYARGLHVDKEKIVGRLSSAEQTVALLLAYGADVNAKSEYGATPLHIAAGENNDKVVSLLISYGANINAQTDDGSTPLAVAIEQNAGQAEKVLRAYGAK